MMKFGIILSLTFLFLVGCGKSSLRYGANNEAPRRELSSSGYQFTTDNTIKLGRILQGYLGRPYAGSSKYNPGLDCSLFTGDVFKKYAGIQLPRTSEEQFKTGAPVNKDQLAFGDLVFFNTDGRGVSHVGVYIGHNEFIHASTSNGIIISGMQEKYWSKKYMGARRIIK